MSSGSMAARAAVVGLSVLASLTLNAAPTWANGGTVMCIKPGSAVLAANSGGTCPPSYTPTLLGAEGKEGKQGPEGKEGKQGPEGKNALSEEELTTLKGILPCIKSVSKGIAGTPTVQFSGCNVQIVNGMGKTASTNGAGNLVIGYDELGVFEPKQTGSHDLILGEGQTFTSYGGIVAGVNDTIGAPFASVSGGKFNTASAARASVSGGEENAASNEGASVSGGNLNTASGYVSSVSGGQDNKATVLLASVSGGEDNTADAPASSVSGGYGNIASGPGGSSVSGGYKNLVEGRFASIFGGKELTAKNEYEAIP